MDLNLLNLQEMLDYSSSVCVKSSSITINLSRGKYVASLREDGKTITFGLGNSITSALESLEEMATEIVNEE